MRLDTRDDSFDPALFGTRVWLDGVELSDVLMCDDEAGEVVRSVRDEAGDLVVIGNDIQTETLRGVVRIQPPHAQ